MTYRETHPDRSCALALVLALLTACTSETGLPEPAVAAEGTSNRDTRSELLTKAWDCETSGYIVTSKAAEPAGLWLFWPGETVRLPLAGSVDSGSEEFSDGQTSVVITGRTTIIKRGSITDTCAENRRMSIREDAKLRGMDFWATGNEPPWQLEIGPDIILLKTGYESTRNEFPAAQPAEDAANRRAFYSTVNAEHTLIITLSGKACMDSMSGEPFATTVEISLDDHNLMGCGLALH